MRGIGGKGVTCTDVGGITVQGVVARVGGIGSGVGRARFDAIEDLAEGDASPVAADKVRDEQ